MAWPQHFRLRGRRDIQKVFKTGRKFKNRFFLAVSLRNDLGHPRVAIIVSKKISSSAVIRNRIRRIVGEISRAGLSKSLERDISINVLEYEKDKPVFISQLKQLVLQLNAHDQSR